MTVFFTIGTPLVHCWYSLGRPVFGDWFSVPFVKNSQKQSKDSQNSNNHHCCTNRHMSMQSSRIHKAAQTPLPCETSITCAWTVATARRPWAELTVCVYMATWTSMRLAPVRCRVLLHSLLPTDDACSSSSLSTTVIKFSIFSDPTRN